MYAVISEGALVALCDKPRYVKINENTGLYVRAEKEDAIGISVNGKLYNLPGSSEIVDAPEAIVRDGDISEYVFSNRAKIEVNAESTETAFVSVKMQFVSWIQVYRTGLLLLKRHCVNSIL